MIFNTINGGTSLKSIFNFSIIGGKERPTLPEENTIWVDTDAEINGWEFCDISNPDWSSVEGHLCINSQITNVHHDMNFNVLKKNEISISPISAKQYINGQWQTVSCYIYKNGAWKSWITYLYNNGDQCASLTGGWGSIIAKRFSDYGDLTLPTVTFGSNSFTIQGTAIHGCIVHTKNRIDLTNFNTLTFHGVITLTADDGSKPEKDAMFGVWSNLTDCQVCTTDAVTYVNGETNDKLEVDISELSGSYFVGVHLFKLVNTNPYLECFQITLS